MKQDLIKKVDKYFDSVGLERKRKKNGDVPTEFSRKILDERIREYLKGNIDIEYFYAFAGVLCGEVCLTNPADQELFQIIHDIQYMEEKKATEKKIREYLEGIIDKLGK